MDFSPVWISLKTTVCSSVITFVLGIVAAWAVMFIKSKKWKAAVDGFLTIPLVLPPTVAGFFLLWLLGQDGLLEALWRRPLVSGLFFPGSLLCLRQWSYRFLSCTVLRKQDLSRSTRT